MSADDTSATTASGRPRRAAATKKAAEPEPVEKKAPAKPRGRKAAGDGEATAAVSSTTTTVTTTTTTSTTTAVAMAVDAGAATASTAETTGEGPLAASETPAQAGDGKRARTTAGKEAKTTGGKPAAKAGDGERANPIKSRDDAVPALTADDSKYLKIATWNVNGLNAMMDKGSLAEYVRKEQPDVLCLQETKIKDATRVKGILGGEAHESWSNAEQAGYAGTATLSKMQPVAVLHGLGKPEHDSEGRCITVEFAKFYLVNTYVPNSGQKLDRLAYRCDNWDRDFLAFLQELDKKKPVIWCGDLNVAHLETDLTNPATNKRTAGFTPQERQNFTRLLDAGFVDVWRRRNPEATGQYSFWTFRGGARERNIGWRLDYFVVSARLADSVVDCALRTHVLGSDHCPMVLLLPRDLAQ